MSSDVLDAESVVPSSSAPQRQGLFSIGSAVRDTFREGYDFAALRADVVAGIIVGIVALPLSMALGIASGTPPEHGLYTAIVAGIVAALCGGAHLQVTGPTAAFVVLLVPVSSRYGLGGLCLASVMAGIMLLTMATLRLGRLIRFVPHPVILGFTGGIAVVIATLQLKDFLGLSIAEMPETYLGKLLALGEALPTFAPSDLAVGIATLAVLLLLPRVTTKVPAPLVALLIASALALGIDRYAPDAGVRTIAKRFSYVEKGLLHPGIPHRPPTPGLAWFEKGVNGAKLALDWELIRALLPSAFAIAMLAAIESLLAAVVADKMSGKRHNSDAELVGVGLANVIAPFFGGFAATGAIARTATNIRSGARSPFAAVLHACFVLASMMLLAPWLGHLPMSGLAALLLVMAYRMGDFGGIWHHLKHSPRPDAFLLVLCLMLTVFFDMVISVGAGLIVATLFFCVRMAQTTQVTYVPPSGNAAEARVVAVRGPLFFGAASATLGPLGLLAAQPASPQGLILDLAEVTALDATGLVSLEGLLDKLRARDHRVTFVAARNARANAALTQHFQAGGTAHKVPIAGSRDDAQQHLAASGGFLH